MTRVMIVDDDENILKSLKGILSGEDYEIELVSSGQKALELLGIFKPEALILDIKMPEMDGFEVCHRIRANSDERIKRIPIIMITGHHYEREEILKAGADDFLEKPIDRTEVLFRLRWVLKITKLTSELESTKTYLKKIKKAS